VKPRIIAFVDHEIGWRLLEKIISTQEDNGFVLVSAITTQENGQLWWPGVSDLCASAGVPLLRYPEQLPEILDYKGVDWYFLLSWKYIIPQQLINHPLCGAINLHYSLLPEYRGVYPVNWAIIEGKRVTGVTYHLVNNKIDDGQILFQHEAPIKLSDTARTLQLRLDDLAFVMFDDVLKWAIEKRGGNSNKFDHENINEGSYKSRSSFVQSNEIDLNREYRAIDLLNLLKGKTFRPETRTLYFVDQESGRRIYVSIILTEEDLHCKCPHQYHPKDGIKK
jgi:methionyl-tRNA formyltransferase